MKFVIDGNKTKTARGNKAKELMEHISELFTKDEVIAMLEEIQLEIAELPAHVVSNKGSIIRMEIAPSAEDVYEVIQQKIDKLRGENNG